MGQRQQKTGKVSGSDFFKKTTQKTKKTAKKTAFKNCGANSKKMFVNMTTAKILNMPPSAAHNGSKRLREAGEISAHKGQGGSDLGAG